MEYQEIDDLKITISKEELGSLPAAQFEGEVILVDDPGQVEGAIADLRDSDIIGFDTETRPSFKKGMSNKVSLMQLANRRRCYLFRLNKIGMPELLKELIEDESLLKVGLSIHDDFHNLHKICEISPAGFVDLQPYVKKFLIADNSLSKIYAIVFGKRISKGQRLTNWEAEVLTPMQCRYAALDAIACISIYDEVTSGAFHPLQSPYLHEVPKEELPEPAPKTESTPKPKRPVAQKRPARKSAAAKKTTGKDPTERKTAIRKAAAKRTAGKRTAGKTRRPRSANPKVSEPAGEKTAE